MGVTYIPGSGQLPQQQRPDQGLVQLAMAVQQMKQGQEIQKKQEAYQLLDFATKNPQNALLIDPGSLEKAFGTLGWKLSKPEDIQAALGNMQQGGGPPAPAGKGKGPLMSAQNPPVVPQPVGMNSLEQLGKTMGGPPAGAQAGTPPTDHSALERPGGGVPPGGIVAPGSGALQHVVDVANQSYASQLSGVGALYSRGISAAQQQYMLQQRQQQLQTLADNYRTTGDMRSLGKLYAEAAVLDPNFKVGKDMIQTAMLGSNDPKDQEAALNFFRGHMTDAEEADYTQKTISALGSNKEFMESLVDQRVLPQAARQLVTTGKIDPDLLKGLAVKPSDYTAIATQQQQYVNQGFSPKDAYNAAYNQIVLHVSPDLGTAGLAGGLTLQQREAATKEKTAGAAAESAQAELDKVKVESAQLDLARAQDPAFGTAIDQLVKMKAAGVDQDVIDAQMQKIGVMRGDLLDPVRHWYHFWARSYDSAYGGNIVPEALRGGTPQVNNGKGTVSSPAPAPDLQSLSKIDLTKPINAPDTEKPPAGYVYVTTPNGGRKLITKEAADILKEQP